MARYKHIDTSPRFIAVDLERQLLPGSFEHALMLARHRQNDTLPAEPTSDTKAQQRIDRLQKESAQLRDWLAANPEDRKGSKGSIRKSNRTDNQSAKMATGKGVIQGYTGVAAVDGKHQIIVEAQAHGTGSEQELLLPLIQATDSLRTDQTLITADAGYHSEANIKALAEQEKGGEVLNPAEQPFLEKSALAGRRGSEFGR